MPVMENSRQELYCKHRANGFVPKRAAIAAGYATGSAVYTGLESDPDVQARIAELIDDKQRVKDARIEAAQKAAEISGEITGTSQGWVIAQLKLNAEDAREAGSYKESNDALIKIGEHLGMWGKGAGAEDNGKGGTAADQLVNSDMMDRLIAVTDELHGGPDTRNEPLALPDAKTVNDLIAGHAKITPKERELATGSETDVALERDDEEDAQ